MSLSLLSGESEFLSGSCGMGFSGFWGRAKFPRGRLPSEMEIPVKFRIWVGEKSRELISKIVHSTRGVEEGGAIGMELVRCARVEWFGKRWEPKTEGDKKTGMLVISRSQDSRSISKPPENGGFIKPYSSN